MLRVDAGYFSGEIHPASTSRCGRPGRRGRRSRRGRRRRQNKKGRVPPSEEPGPSFVAAGEKT